MNCIIRSPPSARRLLKQARQLRLEWQKFYPKFKKAAFPFSEFLDVPHTKTIDELKRFSQENTEIFWGRLAHSRLKWDSDFHTVQACNLSEGKIAWFLGGKLNASVNCIDRHACKFPDSLALIWEKDEPGHEEYVTYKELSDMVCRVANVLRNSGVKKGDRVVLYLPVAPITIATMLACARIGAIHVVVFANYSPEALATQIQNAEAETLVTCDTRVQAGKVIKVHKAVITVAQSCPTLKQIFIYQHKDGPVRLGNKDILLRKAMEAEKTVCTPEPMDSEDVLFLLYTSGSTGKPKGVVHSTAGYLLYAATTFKHIFDFERGQKFGCLADIGWIAGHSYGCYGPLCNGGTTLLFDSSPLYPNPGRCWEMVERLKLNHLYLAPTLLRRLLKPGDTWVSKYDMSSLKCLSSVGEPLNRHAWNWLYKKVGKEKCDIVDTWGKTETGGACIAPRPSLPDAEIIPTMAMRPFFAIQPALIGDDNKEMDGNDKYGSLCIKTPWPGMARSVWQDHQLYLDTYIKPYPGYFYTGDGAVRQQGYYKIIGLLDDVVNVCGHRLSNIEMEEILDDHEAVAESAVVGFPDVVNGAGLFAFVVLKDGVQKSEKSISDELKATVKEAITNFIHPDFLLSFHIVFTPGLPWTHSGKILRRVLRKIAANETHDLGDLTSLGDRSVVDAIIVKYHDYMKQQKQSN